MVVNLTYIPDGNILQVVLNFDYNGLNQYTIARIELDNTGVTTDLKLLLEDPEFINICDQAIDARKKVIDTPIDPIFMDRKQIMDIGPLKDPLL